MGQIWYICSLDRREFLSGNKLGEAFSCGENDCLIDYLTVRNPLQQFQTAREPLVTDQSTSPLYKLPADVLLMILDYLDPESCCSFALIATRFWNIGWPYFKRLVQDSMNLWAGNRIVCLGEYNDSSDLPFGITEAERDSIKLGFFEYPEDLDEFLEDQEHARDAIECGVELFEKVDSNPRPYLNFGGSIIHHSHHLPKEIGREAIRFVMEGPSYDEHPGQWVLRDITAREFVRADGLIAAFHDPEMFKDRRHRNGPHIGFPGLGDAALRRICWSTDTSTAPCDGIDRGPWAGHRLDICTLQQHDILSDGEWKDVTGDVIDELRMVL